MNSRQKTAHLLRRFGLGATKAELDIYEPMGVDGALEALLNYDKVDEGFDVSPWELCFEENNPQFYLDPFRIVAWWSLRLLLTKRPLQEKLTLFWHDHFAVSATKIEFGPMMLDYMEAIRSNATGNFKTLLEDVSKTPAMLRWLDADENTKGHPNENFAREVMELFTLGIGNYSEKDVKEASRAFTGWGLRYLVFERGGERVQETAKECIEKGKPMVAFSETPSLYDDGPKTILGKTANYTGEQVLDMLAMRPETAKYLAKKLWTFFAYENPSQAVVDRIAKVYLDSKGEIKPVLRAIAKSEEFWSEKCVRAIVKSPFDFSVPIARQFGVADFIRGLRVKPKSPLTPLAKPLRDTSGVIFGLMYKQGMLLLYPPDVSGWDWGQAWITSNNMLERIKVADVVFGTYNNEQPLAAFLAATMIQRKAPKTAGDVVDALIENFDASVPPEKRQLMVAACEKAGGAATLVSPQRAAQMFTSVCHLMFATPEFQFC